MAIAFSNAASNALKKVSSITVTINTAANDTIIVCVHINDVTTTVSSVSDTIGNKYADRGVIPSSGIGGNRSVIWVAPKSTGSNAANVVTVSLSASTNVVVSVATYTGVVTIGPASGTSGTGTSAIVSVTTQNANDWVVVGVGTQGVGTISAGASTTQETSASTSGGGAASNIAGDECDSGAVGSPASTTLTITISASQPWAAVAVLLSTALVFTSSLTALITGAGLRCRDSV